MTYTVPFAQLDKNSIPTAGGKGANLGEMTAAGLPVPPGFVLTTAAYDDFVQAHGLQQQIVDLASKASGGDPQSSADASSAIKKLFLAADMPEAIREDLLSAYADLTTDEIPAKAVRLKSNRCRAFLSHSRGLADGQFCWPAGYLSQCTGPRALCSRP